MSRTYWSESKQREIPMAEMADAHICNAFRKLQAKLDSCTTDDERLGSVSGAALLDLEEEMKERGLDPKHPNGRPPEEVTR